MLPSSNNRSKQYCIAKEENIQYWKQTMRAIMTMLSATIGLLSGRSSLAAFVGMDSMMLSRSRFAASSRLASSYLDHLERGAVAAMGGSPFSTATGTTTTTSSSSATTTTASEDNFAYIPILSLYQADTIANKAIQCCLRNNFNPVSVYVLDHSGHTLVHKRMDGCSPVGIPDFAHAKAFSCIVNKYPSRAFRDRYTSDESSAKFCQMMGMVSVSQGKMAPFPGGILVKLGEFIVGAVGVSGAAGDEDEYCAIRGVIESEFVGLTTIPEHHSCSTVKD